MPAACPHGAFTFVCYDGRKTRKKNTLWDFKPFVEQQTKKPRADKPQASLYFDCSFFSGERETPAGKPQASSCFFT